MKKRSKLTKLAALLLVGIIGLTSCTAPADSGGDADTDSESNVDVGYEEDDDGTVGGDGIDVTLTDLNLEPAEGFVSGGSLTISGYYDPPPALSGNHYVTTAGYPTNMKEFTFIKLFDYAPLPEQTFIPWLATGFTNEGKVTTITLNPDYKWSNGESVTAADVVTTFNMKFIFNDQVWKYLDDIVAIDDTTLELTWAVEGQYLAVMANAFFIDSPTSVYGKWADQADDFKATRTFNETKGEYENTEATNDAMLEIREEVFQYLPDVTEVPTNSIYTVTSVNASEMTATRNPEYPYHDVVAFDSVVLQRYVSIEAWLSTVMSGGYDVEPHGATPDVFTQLENNNPEMVTMWVPDLGQPAYEFNLQKYPMNIPEVRKAIVYAIDRDALIPISEPGTEPGDDYITGLTPLWRDVFMDEELESELVDYSYDPAKAEELLKGIGWTNDSGTWKNENGEVVEIEVSAMNSWPIYFITGDAITNMLKDFGFEASYNAMELSSYWNYIDNAEHMIAADFRGGGHTFGYWEAYKNLYLDSNNRIGFLTQEERDADPNAPIMIEDADGNEYDMRSLISQMFSSADNEEAKEAVQSAMLATNNTVPFMPIGEKWAPIKIHNTQLTGYPTDSQSNPLWYCVANMVGIVRLIRHGQIYYADGGASTN